MSFERPTDEEIVQYELRVKDNENKGKQFILPLELGFNSLYGIYEHSESFGIFLKHIEELSKNFIGYREILGDGNCFFRAFVCLFYQNIVHIYFNEKETYLKPVLFELLKAKVHKLEMSFNQVGFQNLIIDEFQEVFNGLLSSLETRLNSGASESTCITFLENQLNEQEISNYIIVYFKLIASAYLRSHASEYEPFLAFRSLGDQALEGGGGGAGRGDNGGGSMMSILSYCSNVVEAFGKESDDLCITALVQALSIPITVMNMDASHDKLLMYAFEPKDSNLEKYSESMKMYLLYRPGHYDVLQKH